MNNMNPRLSISHAALYCEEYVRWGRLVRKPVFAYRRMHEESIGLAAFDWFGGSVIKAIIMYVVFPYLKSIYSLEILERPLIARKRRLLRTRS